jgi:hypothetical protein
MKGFQPGLHPIRDAIRLLVKPGVALVPSLPPATGFDPFGVGETLYLAEPG